MYLRDSCDWNSPELLKGIPCWRYNPPEWEDDNTTLFVPGKPHSSTRWPEKSSLVAFIMYIMFVIQWQSVLSLFKEISQPNSFKTECLLLREPNLRVSSFGEGSESGSVIARIILHQRNWSIHSGHRSIYSCDALWYKWSWITNPDPDRPTGTHPKYWWTISGLNRNLDFRLSLGHRALELSLNFSYLWASLDFLFQWLSWTTCLILRPSGMWE